MSRKTPLETPSALAVIPERHAEAPRLLRQMEICRRYGWSVRTWRRWRVSRQVPDPVPNIPGVPRWRERDIEDYARGLYRPQGRVFFGAARRRV